jgi:large subunit ribosomal protein L25
MYGIDSVLPCFRGGVLIMDATLVAEKRTSRGKNEARRLRAAGKIPAVIYGAQKAGDAGNTLELAVDPKPLMRILHSGSGVNTLITLKVDGEGDSRVLVKEYLVDPITHTLLHADFFRVNMDRRITVTVPIVTKGEPRGVKVDGGVLDFVHREVELECLPADIPPAIEVDVSDLGLNDAIYVRDVATNVSWKPISELDLMLLHVIMPRAVEEAAPAASSRRARPRRKARKPPAPRTRRTRSRREAGRRPREPGAEVSRYQTQRRLLGHRRGREALGRQRRMA